MFENKSIKYILERINTDYFLPAIQRDYVWEEKQIINLFDSILKGYPIGTFLFWKVSQENILKYDYYRFITDYDKEKKYNDDKIDNLDSKNEIISILDGQQRLTSLNIGLKGSYKNKKLQYLYVNLSKMNDESDLDDIQNKYLFKFMPEDEQSDKDQWFKVSNILDMSNGDVTMYSIKNSLSELGINILSDLHTFVHERTVINYYLVQENDLDTVLSIFVRINKGGTHLSYSDLLLSIATSKWDNMSARDEINKLIEEVNIIDGEFNVTKDFILKTSLLLINENTKFTSSNLKPENMKKMEKNWDKIRNSIITAFIYLSENNYDNRSLPSMNVASFLSYFFFVSEIKSKNEEIELNKFIFKSLIKNLYSSSIDTVLSQGRKYLEQINISKEFKCDEMLKSIKLKDTIIRKDEISNYSKIKRTQKSFMLLMTRLFESKNIHGLHEIISRNRAKSYEGHYRENLNSIINFQFNKTNDPYLPHTENDYDNLQDEEIDRLLKDREKNIKEKLIELLN